MEILKMSLLASVFILAIIIIRALALHRLPKRTFLALWSVALCRLLIPFSVPSRFSIYTVTAMLETYFSAVDMTVTGTAPINIGPAAGTINTSLAKTASLSISPFIAVWLIGLSVCAAFFLVTHLRWLREYKTALPIDSELVSAWQRVHPTKRKVKIRQSDRIAAPLTYGIFQPVILLPKATDWTDERCLEYILTHELIHIRRFDTLMKLLLVTTVCVHWFNPLVWAMYVLANRDIELSCDEAVVMTFGEAMKSAYALTLIELEEKKNSITPLVNNYSKNAMEERIVSIMKMKRTSVITFVVAALIVVCATTAFATAAKRNTENSASVSSTENPTPTSITIPATAERSAEMKAASPSAEPVTEKVLPEYWKMGALNVKGVPYLPLITTAKNLGYTINVDSKSVDPKWNPEYPNTVEYNYELVKDGKSLGIASLDISDGKVVASMIDGIFCSTHEAVTHNSIVLQKDTVYMPAQFFKEGLDTGNKLP